MKKIGVLGSGVVGETLADGFIKHGHSVMRGSRDPKKLTQWLEKAGSKAQIGTPAQTAQFGDIIVLAVKGTAAEAALDEAGPANLANKCVIDTTNPIADAPPVNGVLNFFSDMNRSLMEQLQAKVPSAHFVKAFSCVGNVFMVNPDFAGDRPTMFICGNDDNAKTDVKGILKTFGWDVADMGKVEAARAIEPLCMLWCIPGLASGSWSHAFKLLRK
jgi:predicted dinucleotide-binding enzyme